MSPKLFRVILPVTDIEAAARFYARIFGEAGRRVSGGRHYFDCEGTILACYDPRADGDGYDAEPNPEILYFAVDDLDAALAAIEPAGGSLAATEDEASQAIGPMGAIARRPWGELSFYASDPFGNRLCFVARPTMFTGADS